MGEDGGEDFGLCEEVEAGVVKGGGERGCVGFGEEMAVRVGEIGAWRVGGADVAADLFFEGFQAECGEFVFPAAAAFVVDENARRQAVAEVDAERVGPFTKVFEVERFDVEGDEHAGFFQPTRERVQNGGFLVAAVGEIVLEQELFALEPHDTDEKNRGLRVGGFRVVGGGDRGEEQIFRPGVLCMAESRRGVEFVDALPGAAENGSEFSRGGKSSRGGLGERQTDEPAGRWHAVDDLGGLVTGERRRGKATWRGRFARRGRLVRVVCSIGLAAGGRWRSLSSTFRPMKRPRGRVARTT